MKNRILISYLIVMGSCISTVGMANPMVCEVLNIRQTPESQHVQITYADDCAQSVEILSL